MEENMSSPEEINSIVYLNKKRKFQAELVGMPLPKHVCWDQRLGYNSSSNSSTDPNKVESNIFARGESDPESAKDSNSFHGDTDSVMSPYDDAKTYLSYPKTCASVEPSTSSGSWGGTSSEISLYSLESRSLKKSSSSKSETLSISEEVDCLHHDYGLHPSYNYEEQILEFESHADSSCSEYKFDGIEHCTDKDLDILLYSNEVSPSNYVLSSGRWSVKQDIEQGPKKLTIDKEFEQYFSMLMLE